MQIHYFWWQSRLWWALRAEVSLWSIRHDKTIEGRRRTTRWLDSENSSDRKERYGGLYTGGLRLSQATVTILSNTKDHAPYTKLSSLLADEQDRIWTGTNDGRLFVLKMATHLVEYWQSGLPDTNSLFSIWSFGRLWIEHKAAASFMDIQNWIKTFQSLTQASHWVRRMSIYCSQINRNTCGLVLKPVLIKSLSNQMAISKNLSFGRNEGFLCIETCHDAASTGADNKLWFGTMMASWEYSPGKLSGKHLLPRHFEMYLLFYKPLDETQYADLSRQMED